MVVVYVFDREMLEAFGLLAEAERSTHIYR
jgi:hypothetical protein